METTTISVGFERKISLAYQSWSYSCHLSENVSHSTPPTSTFSPVRRLRSKLQAEAALSVYLDMREDLSRLATQYSNTSNSEVNRVYAALVMEAQQAIDAYQTKLDNILNRPEGVV